MILPKPADAIHKIQLYRLLTVILDQPILAQNVYFKGGTCASMRGLLDRFSVDLDFDLKIGADKAMIGKKLTETALLFILRYEVSARARNTLKLSVVDNPPRTNVYEAVFLTEIDRYANAQDVETMVANKLVAPLDRFEKYGSIAGRDIYDIHYFLSHGFGYRDEIIKERRGVVAISHLQRLIEFIKKHVTQTIIDQDLNMLLPQDIFQSVRKMLIHETLMLLGDELKRIGKSE